MTIETTDYATAENPPPNARGNCETCGVDIDQWEALGFVFPRHCPEHEPTEDSKAIAAAKAREVERRKEKTRAVIPHLYQEIGARFHGSFPKRAWEEISRWSPPQERTFERSHGLLITGTTGLYKSTMACYHVAKLHIETGVSIGYLSVPEFDTVQRLAWSGSDEDKIAAAIQKKMARSVRVLILDDLGKEGSTDQVEQELHSLVEHRLSKLLPTVFTLNATAEAYEARLSVERSKPFLRRLLDYNRNVHVTD